MKQWLFRIAILGCILPAIAISVAPAAAAGLNLGWAASTAFFDPLTAEAACQNYWQQAASGGFNYVPGVYGQNRGRISAVFAVAGASAGAFTPGSEYYAFRMVVDNRHTVSGAVPVCDG